MEKNNEMYSYTIQIYFQEYYNATKNNLDTVPFSELFQYTLNTFTKHLLCTETNQQLHEHHILLLFLHIVQNQMLPET